jgi:hypothetical protein
MVLTDPQITKNKDRRSAPPGHGSSFTILHSAFIID